MSYYHICPHCGATLDPGEKCDCQKEDVKMHNVFKSPKITEGAVDDDQR